VPNLKIFVDESVFEASRAPLRAALPKVRDVLCEALHVKPAACQLAVIQALGLSDQPQLNVELLILPHVERTNAVVRATATRLRDLLSEVSGAQVAIRIAFLDPLTYVALK
jgi:hypothetical protein